MISEPAVQDPFMQLSTSRSQPQLGTIIAITAVTIIVTTPTILATIIATTASIIATIIVTTPTILATIIATTASIIGAGTKRNFEAARACSRGTQVLKETQKKTAPLKRPLSLFLQHGRVSNACESFGV